MTKTLFLAGALMSVGFCNAKRVPPEPHPDVQAPSAPASDQNDGEEVPPEDADTDLLPEGPLKEAERALRDGDRDEARRLAQEVLEADPDERDALRASYMLQRLDAVPVDPRRIGVLLPLSNRFEAVGRQIQSALELGYGDEDTRELVYADAGETTETAVEALEQLVLEEGVVAVVGPLLSDTAPEVVGAADALGVPLISVAQLSDLAKDRPWVFQAMLTRREQISALLDHAMDERGMRAFGIFAPDNSLGRNSAATFRDEVEARGGEITVETFYDPDDGNLIPYAEAFGRKDYEARRHEIFKLREEARDAGRDPTRVVLPPVVDYDAIFLPDRANRLAIATGGLATEEVPMGHFQPHREDEPPIPLLGLSTWNDSELTRVGPYVRSSIFPEVYPLEATGVAAEVLEGALERRPSTVEAVAYDVGRTLAELGAVDTPTREAFRSALLEVRPTSVATGLSGFDGEHGEPVRELQLLTLDENSRIVPLEEQDEEAPDLR